MAEIFFICIFLNCNLTVVYTHLRIEDGAMACSKGCSFLLVAFMWVFCCLLLLQTVTSAAVVDPDTLPPPPNRFSSVIERIERLYKVVFSFQLGCLFAPLLSYTTIELVWLRQRLLFPY